MDLDIEFLQSEINKDSPDFTAEEVASATDTTDVTDLATKVAAYVQGRLETGAVGNLEYERKLFDGVNYHLVIFNGYRQAFKMGWLSK